MSASLFLYEKWRNDYLSKRRALEIYIKIKRYLSFHR